VIAALRRQLTAKSCHDAYRKSAAIHRERLFIVPPSGGHTLYQYVPKSGFPIDFLDYPK